MTQASTVLALDIGTSSTRAILYDAHGQAVPGAQAQLTYTLTTSHEGEVSVDADLLVELVARTIDETLSKASERAETIVGVATSAFWHTLLPLDAAAHPLLPLMTWEDMRPQQAALDLRARLDETAIHERTGARLHTSYWPAKITWFQHAHPELAQRTARYLSFGEYLHMRFLGRSVCSLSMASGTGLLNIQQQQWDTDLLAQLQLSPAHLPTLGDLSDTLHGLTPEFATRWPALAHVPWFPAIGDGAAANIGSQCAHSSTWAVTMGTSSAMRAVVAPEQVALTPGLWLYAVDHRRALLGGALSEGGNMLAWLKTILKLTEPTTDTRTTDARSAATPNGEQREVQPTTLDERLIELEPAAHGLTILPQLAGERSPGWHAHANMTISGLTLHTTPLEIAQAALEAVVFQLSRIYDELRQALKLPATAQPRLIVSGGALLNSAFLRQVLADTLNCPLEVVASNEASARGAALLALEALGILPDLAQLTPTIAEIVQPDPARHAIYQQARTRQRTLYETLLP